MKLTKEWVTLDVAGVPAEGLFVKPERVSTPLPGIVLVQEAFGVDEFIEDVTGRLARAGYAVIAPNLFSYGGTPEPLAPQRLGAAMRFLDTVPMAAWFDVSLRAQALAKLPEVDRGLLEETFSVLLVQTRPWDEYVATLKAGRAFLSAGPSKGRKVGALGFCLGGALAYRLGCVDPELAAVVAFYGFAPPRELIPGLRAKVLGLYAEHDPRILPGLPDLTAAMSAEGKSFETHVYPGTKHAFMNDTRGPYDPDAARSAWARALGFLDLNLSA